MCWGKQKQDWKIGSVRYDGLSDLREIMSPWNWKLPHGCVWAAAHTGWHVTCGSATGTSWCSSVCRTGLSWGLVSPLGRRGASSRSPGASAITGFTPVSMTTHSWLNLLLSKDCKGNTGADVVLSWGRMEGMWLWAAEPKEGGSSYRLQHQPQKNLKQTHIGETYTTAYKNFQRSLRASNGLFLPASQ